MILHVVTFVWAPEVTDADVAEVCAQLAALPAAVPALSEYHFGPNAALRPGGADFAIVATVPDEAAFDAYIDSPPHREVAHRLRAMAATRSAVQLRTNG